MIDINKYNRINKLREKGLSFQSIGKILSLSRQRVHTIYKSATPSIVKRICILCKNPVGTGRFKFCKEHAKESKRKELWGLGFVREKVRIRDNQTCQICFKKWDPSKRKLDVHHTDEHEGNSGKKGACTWDSKNLDKMITLCHKCHFNLDSVRKKFSKPKH